MLNENIVVKGAKENNLKNIDVTIPKNKLVVFTGVSGSGKSTLAFDTIYQEGQRRYIESLPSYVRQLLGSYEKPNVDSIDGLTPTISIDQKTKSNQPRSTVGTVTEIDNYLRLLFGKIGQAYCINHNTPISALTPQQMVDLILSQVKDTSKLVIYAPLVRNEKGTHKDTLEKFMKAGFSRMKIDDLEETRYNLVPNLDKNKKHNIDIVIDRIIVKENCQERLLEALKAALNVANGFVEVNIDGNIVLYSEHNACPICGFSVPKIEPRLFSFNNPLGCCPDCKGIGVNISCDPYLLVPNPELTILQGAVKFVTVNKIETNFVDFLELKAICEKYDIPMDVPFSSLTKKQKDYIFYGPSEPINFKIRTNSGSLLNKTVSEGIITKINRLYTTTNSEMMKRYYAMFMSSTICNTCHGTR